MDVGSLNRYVLQVLLLGIILVSMPVVLAGPGDAGQEGVESPVLGESVELPPEPSKAGPTEGEEEEAPLGKNGKEDKPPNAEEDKPPNAASQKLKVCGPDDKECSRIATYLLGLYLLALVIGRLFWVIEPNNQYLMAHADRIEYRLDVEQDPNARKDDQYEARLLKIKEYLEKVRVVLNQSRWKWLIAFTGRQMSAWRSLHEAERLATDFYSPEVVRDQANLILDKLRETQSATTTLEDQLRKGIEEGRPDLRALVKEAKAIIYRDEDGQFETLADAQNKALWLVLTAAMILFGLSMIFPQAQVLFLAGAAGGLLARLRKVVKKRSLPFDYGVSWTVLFLSPLVGALTGWAGTLLFVLLQAWELIGEQFAGISITEPTYATLMVALVFGFSATLFEKFVEQLEESLSKK